MKKGYIDKKEYKNIAEIYLSVDDIDINTTPIFEENFKANFKRQDYTY